MSKVLKTEKTVSLGKKRVVVSKLPLRKLVQILQSFQGNVEELKKLSESENIPLQIAMGIEAFAPVVVMALEHQIEVDDLLDASLEEVIDLLTVIMEVNNVAGIIEKLKKGIALVQPAKGAM